MACLVQRQSLLCLLLPTSSIVSIGWNIPPKGHIRHIVEGFDHGSPVNQAYSSLSRHWISWTWRSHPASSPPESQPRQANTITVISLFFKDAGIEFQDERYPYDDTWAAASKSLQTRGLSTTGKVPVLEYNGAILTQVGIGP